jgi:hypothetical protein
MRGGRTDPPPRHGGENEHEHRHRGQQPGEGGRHGPSGRRNRPHATGDDEHPHPDVHPARGEGPLHHIGRNEGPLQHAEQTGAGEQQRRTHWRSDQDPGRHVLRRGSALTSGDDRDHSRRRQRERRPSPARAVAEASLGEGDEQDRQGSEPEEFHVL